MSEVDNVVPVDPTEFKRLQKKIEFGDYRGPLFVGMNDCLKRVDHGHVAHLACNDMAEDNIAIEIGEKKPFEAALQFIPLLNNDSQGMSHPWGQGARI
jgi:hypothetical protein